MTCENYGVAPAGSYGAQKLNPLDSTFRKIKAGDFAGAFNTHNIGELLRTGHVSQTKDTQSQSAAASL